ncbi:MAG: hypothetical protein P8013_03430 [Candidatus Sulfobium sp.]
MHYHERHVRDRRICGVAATGACSAENGTCTGTGNNKICSGGGRDGAPCHNDKDCQISLCTAGRIGVLCTQDSDCDIKRCTNSGIANGNICVVNADCDTGTCSSPASMAGTACAVDSDCNANICDSGPNLGKRCTSDWDCSDNKGHCLLPVTTQIKSTFAQSMNSCYQYQFAGFDVGQNEITMVNNPQGCNQIYAEYRVCNGGAKDGLQCGSDTDCPTGKCISGPDAIRSGSPVLLCSTAYAGYCATSTDNWATTKWVGREYAAGDGHTATENCILAKFRAYCGALDIPPVTDPTTDTSNTGSYINLPAVVSDLAVGAQLGAPIYSLPVNIAVSGVPRGLIQDFAGVIRIGAMSFDYNGSSTECAVRDDAAKTVSGNGPAFCSNDKAQSCTADSACSNGGICYPLVPCPYVCDSNTNDPYKGRPCTLLPGGATNDCPGGSCIPSASSGANQSNFDGAEILPSSHIPDKGEKIPITPNGGHASAGIINSIDNLWAGAWTPFSEGLYNTIGYYALTDSTTDASAMRINTGDFDLTPVPSQNLCQKNNVLLITDGQSTADLNGKVKTAFDTYSGQLPAGDLTTHFDTITGITTADSSNSCVAYAGSRNVQQMAWLAQNRDIHDFTQSPQNYSQKVATYTVFTGTGNLDSQTCSDYSDTDLSGLDDCKSDNLMCKTARYGGGRYYLAQDPAALRTSLKNAFLEIAAKATSGTAASVLASGEGSGANLIQALFYPRRQFDFHTEMYWAGSLQNLWYYVDPFFSNSNIREDTPDSSTGVQDGVLDLKKDYVARLFLNTDPTINRVQEERYLDTDGNGSPDSYVDTIDIENIHSLWEAGKLLWKTPASDRTIYTDCDLKDASATCLDQDGKGTGLMYFKTDNAAVLQPYLQAGSANEASKLISWVRGYDRFCTGTTTPCTSDADCTSPTTCSDDPYRSRTVSIDLDGSGGAGPDSGETNVWKLGDVLNSTPRVASWLPLNYYNLVYGDTDYGPLDAPAYGTVDNAYFTTSSPGYSDRGMVFAGANDGMLHAFRLGTLQLKWTGQGNYEKARLLRTCTGDHTQECTSDAECVATGKGTCPEKGEEIWAFIPKDVLPYLEYTADKQYCHVYSVDLTPYVFDASVEGPSTACTETDYWKCDKDKDSFRTIVIGGMRYGGACKAKVCSVTTSQKCSQDSDCPAGETCESPATSDVGTPILDPADNTKGLGYSAYFALDVTENLYDASKKPKLLWEFSNEDLGFSTTGPAIVRIATKTGDTNGDGKTDWQDDSDKSKDGRWFAVIGSGPTGPIANRQFSGTSDQNLKLFVLDLKTGELLRTIDTGITNAFAGSMLNATMDVNNDYQDDVLYGGYVKKCVSGDPCTADTWTDGGVWRLVTNDDLDPDDWTVSKVIDGIGPVTSSVVKLQDNRNSELWLYFGTGRYFYKTATEKDDNDEVRTIFGVTEPCYTSSGSSISASCNSQRTMSSLNNATDIGDVAQDADGWRIDLADPYTDSDATKSLGAERVITDPLATTSGAVFFTTYAPYSTLCELGGKSYIWAVKYDTGGEAGAILKGKAILQISTGSIEQVDMATAFTGSGNRKTAGMEGVPPIAQGLSILAPPPPVKSVVHIRER